MPQWEDPEGLLQEVLGHPDIKVTKGPDSKGEHTAWCIFHPDGQGKPPHNPNLRISTRGFYCHVCKEGGSLYKLAKHIGLDVGGKGGSEPEAAYSYYDEDGVLLFQVVRFPGKQFRSKRPSGADWEWGLGKVRRVLYNLPHILENKDDDVYIAEGEKDADRLAMLGLLATTCLNGAGKWRDEYADCLKDRNVVILPDNDRAGQEHAQDIVRTLKAGAKSIKVVTLEGLDEKGDVSDWLGQGHTVKELEQVIAKTPVVGDILQVVSKNAEAKVREAVVKTLLPDISFLVGEDNRLFLRAEVGWKRLRFKELFRRVMGLIFSLSGNYPSNSKVRELAQTVTMMVDQEVTYTDLPTVAMNSRIISLDPRTGELVDVAPVGVFPHLYYNYIEDPDPAKWMVFLETIIPDKPLRDILQEFLGVALFPNYNPQKALLLIGPGANGKTTLIAVLSHLFKSYTSSVNINMLEDARMVDALDNALLNVSEETLTDKIVSSAGFKAVMADSLMMANPKYQPAYTIRPTAKWVIATNSFPMFDETTQALARRLLFLPMDVVISQKKRRALTEILASLRPERDHIVSWMLQGAQRYFREQGFTYSAKSEACLDEWRHENSPILFWLRTDEMAVGNYRVSLLYDKFKWWARDNGFRQLSTKSFSRRLSSLGFTKERRSDGLWVYLSKSKHESFRRMLQEDGGDV